MVGLLGSDIGCMVFSVALSGVQENRWRHPSLSAFECYTTRREKTLAVVAKLREMKLKAAAKCVESGAEETLSYMSYPPEHPRNLRTNNPL